MKIMNPNFEFTAIEAVPYEILKCHNSKNLKYSYIKKESKNDVIIEEA